MSNLNPLSPKRKSKEAKEEIFSLLRELKSLLEEETKALKKMDVTLLGELIPKKLYLVEQIEKVFSKEDVKELFHSEERKTVRELAISLKRQNEYNRVFAEEATKTFSDFLSLLIPAQYNSNGKTKVPSIAFRGVTFSKEA